MPKPAIKARTLSLILSLSLLAACGGSPAAPESPPPDPPASASPAPAEPERPDGILPQEDPERPGALAGCDSCYGHWRTLYAVDPATGGHRVARESDFWNGLETVAASPSGSRLLLATGNNYNGSGIPLVAALSVYDIQQDRLTDLSRPAGEEMTYGGRWMDHSHWFPDRHGYRFLDEDTIVCQELFYSPAAPEVLGCRRRRLGELAGAAAGMPAPGHQGLRRQVGPRLYLPPGGREHPLPGPHPGTGVGVARLGRGEWQAAVPKPGGGQRPRGSHPAGAAPVPRRRSPAGAVAGGSHQIRPLPYPHRPAAHRRTPLFSKNHPSHITYH